MRKVTQKQAQNTSVGTERGKQRQKLIDPDRDRAVTYMVTGFNNLSSTQGHFKAKTERDRNMTGQRDRIVITF